MDPQYYRRERPLATAGNVPLDSRDIYELTADYRETEHAGRVMTQFGMDAVRMMDEAEAVDQLNTAQADAAARFNQFHQSLAGRTDTDKWMAEYERVRADVKNSLSKGLTNKKAAEHFENWFKDEEVRQQDTTFWRMQQRMESNQRQNLKLNLDKWRDYGVNAANERDYEYAAGMLEKTIREGANQTLNPETKKWELNANGMSFLQIDPETADAMVEQEMAGMAAGRAKAVMQATAMSMPWDEAQKTLTDQKFLNSIGATPEQAAEVLRNVSTIRKNQEEAQKASYKENERNLYKSLVKKQLTQDDLDEALETDQIDAPTHKQLSKDLHTKHPVLTDREKNANIKEAIRDYKLGQKNYEEVEKLWKENSKNLSDADYEARQNELYGAQEDVLKGSVNPAVERRIKMDATYIKDVLQKVGFLGDKETVSPETQEWAQLYDQRLTELERFWKQNPNATPEQAQKFRDLLVEDVWSKGRNKYLDADRMEAVNSKIKAELAKYTIENTGGSYQLDEDGTVEKKPINLEIEPATMEEFTNTVRGIADENEAREYYNRWVGKW